MITCVALVAGFYFSSAWGKARLVAGRADVLFTVGGDLDRPVPWSAIAAVINEGRELKLVFQSGRARRLRFEFLNTEDRLNAIATVIRYQLSMRKLGPLKLPSASEIRLETERLMLRPLIESDRSASLEIGMAEETRSQQLSIPYSAKSESDIFDLRILANASTLGNWHLAVEKRGVPIGFLSLTVGDYVHRWATLGFDFDQDYANQGFATEAVTAVLEFARKETTLVKVQASCFADNLACCRVLEKSGMTHIGSSQRFWLPDASSEWKASEDYEWLLAEARDKT